MIAVLIRSGSMGTLSLEVPGRDLAGVLQGLAFLEKSSTRTGKRNHPQIAAKRVAGWWEEAT